MSKLLTHFNYQYFFKIPEDSKLALAWFGFFAFALVLSFAITFYLNKRFKGLRPYKSFIKLFFWTNFGLSLSGLVFSFLRYEKAGFLSYRSWQYLFLVLILAFNFWLVVFERKNLEERVLDFKQKQRKEKWLKPEKRKRKK